jgi:glutamate N-acetyltransferase/amino-acid N-acetyltransferase
MFDIKAIPDGSVTTPQGFQAAGAACGLKPTGAAALALVYSDAPCPAAAMFTTNLFQAAPVLYDRKVLAGNADHLRAVVINSGCANACTGAQVWPTPGPPPRPPRHSWACPPTRSWSCPPA